MLSNKYGFIAKINDLMTKKGLFSSLILGAKAEEPVVNNEGEGEESSTEPKATQPVINYEDLIAKARKEEKDKLYVKITKLETERDNLVTKHNNALLSIGDKDSKIKELEATIKELEATKSKSESEQVASLKKEITTLKKTIKDLEGSQVNADSLREEISKEYEVKLYREQKLGEFKDSIIPELVIGSTKEDIDSSIEVAKARFEEIASKFKSPSSTLPKPVNISTNSVAVSTELTPEEIARMSPSEWAEARKQLHLR